MTVAGDLARYVCSLEYNDIDGKVIHEAKRRVLDAMGCAIGAYYAEPVKIVRDIAKQVSGTSTIIGTRYKTSPGLAAMVNTTMSRYLDFMDTYFYNGEYIHPEDMIPGLLAIAESEKCSGEDVLVAIVAAYEIACRFVDQFNIRKRGWDHVIWITMAEALATSRLLGLDEAKTAEAVSMAITQSIPLRQVRIGKLSMWKAMSVAKSSFDAVLAARLANGGITGPTDVFEGSKGFFNQVTGTSVFSMDKFCSKGTGFRIIDTHIKKWPAEINSMSAIEASLQLRPKIGGAIIKNIDVLTFTAGYEIIADKTKWNPANRETADHSLPYIVCAALLDGDINESTFSDERINDPKLRALLKKTTVKPDAQCDKEYYPGTPTVVRVTTSKGTFTEKVVHPRGFSKNPMNDKELEEKFRNLTAKYMDKVNINSAAKTAWNLDKEKNVSGLLKSLTVKK